MQFDPKTGNVICESCGNSITIEAAKAMQKTGHSDDEFDWGKYKKGLQNTEKVETLVYTCKNCGATFEVDGNTAATTCPYCDSNVVLSERVNAGLQPNKIIPFKVDRRQLEHLLAKYHSKKKLLPKTFFSESTISKAQGVYVPFWLFQGTLDGEVILDGQRVSTRREGDYQVTRTDYYKLEREGCMSFEKLPVDASVKMDNALMDSLEPYDYSQMVDFNSAYLAGFLADKFDSDPDRELPRATRRMMRTVSDAFAKTASDYSGVTISTNNLHLEDTDVMYALIPVYLLNCEYNGKKYQYAVNGQTGKVVGDLPISKSRCLKFFCLYGGIAGAIVAAFLSFMVL